ncbi:MAG TPA: AIPR family protein [Thermoleophilaceae bacterium]|nr:AIPR family protein [Thermoleophilaceae bacterium]
MSDEHDLNAFAENVRQDVLVTAETEGDEALRSEVFTESMLQTLQEAGEIEDALACYHRDRGIEVSGYGVDDETTLNLFATIYRGDVPPASITRTDIDTALRRLVKFWERCRDSAYHRELEESSDQFDMALRLHTVRHTIDRVRLFLLTDGLARVEFRAVEEHAEVRIDHAIWDMRRLQRCVTSGQRREPIEIDFESRFGGPIPCLSAQEPGADYTAYLAIIPADVLNELYAQYGARLLELNVRSFLQARGKVNRGIRDTILGEPERFLAYNNGISATASRVELGRLPDGGLGIARIADLQIVNGGQTTASIHHAVRREKADVSRVFVQAKITVVPEERLDGIVPLISRYANSQNRVSEADLSANDPFHVAVENLSRTIWAPATDGTQRQTRWFYERARGQYADALAREGTPARQRAFRQQNPSQQKFTKTDLAKFENTWDQLPHEVSRGAQKNFVVFMQRLRERGSVEPDQAYFQDLVAKAILFRRAERLVSDQNFGGYRANIVTYTLALLSNRTAQRVDLERIWAEQEIGPAVAGVIVELSHRVHQVLTDPPGAANVTEYAKRDGCWTRIRELDVTLAADLESELMELGPRRRRRPSGIDTVQPEERALIQEMSAVAGETWFALANWAKETDNLQPWQRSLAFSLGRLAGQGREPSRKQAVQGKRILEEADRLGFLVNAAA